jgi:hypothetical protein
MKKSLLYALFILIIPIKSIAQRSSGAKVDTLVKNNVDTVNDIKHRHPYIPQQEIVNSFSGHYVKDIAQPGNTNHHLYKEYVARDNSLMQAAKTGLLDYLKKYPNEFSDGSLKLKNTNEINNCKLIIMPVYYLTHNIASYNNEASLTPFFNLDTSAITYRLIKENKLVGIITYKKGKSYFEPFYLEDTLSYLKIIAMHKEPVKFKSNILGGSPSNDTLWGYISKGHIVFVRCHEGDYIEHSTGSTVTKKVYIKTCKIETAEAFYLGSDSTSGYLPYAIKGGEHYLEYLKSREKLKNKN